MKDILKKVNMSELVNVRVWHNEAGEVDVTFDPIDLTKNLIIDEKALASLTAELNERMIGTSLTHPNTKPYLEEYCAKWLNEFAKKDLVILEDAKLDD